MPFSSRFQNSLNDLSHKIFVAGQCRQAGGCRCKAIVLIAALVFVVFLTDAAAQSIANMAKERVNAKAGQQQPVQPEPLDPSIAVPTRVLMPDLISPGFTFDKAEAELKQRKITVDERREEYSSDVEASKLVAQFPKANTPLTPDPYIMLVVSKGPDPSLSTADLSVDVTLKTKDPYLESQVVQYDIVVNNLGRVLAKDVRVVSAPKNLRIDRSSAPCTDMNTCVIPSIEPNKPVTINVTATILRAGDFDNIVTAKGIQTDPDPTNNIDFAGNGGTVTTAPDGPPSNGTPKPDPDFPWEWVVLGTAGGLLTGGIVTKVLSPSPKPHPNPTGTTPHGPTNDVPSGPPPPAVHTYVDLETGPSYCEPFPIDGPALSLKADLELGRMYVDENIPILKEEVVNE